MANLQRGEVELTAGTTTYTLRLTFNAICAMETRTGKTYGQLIGGLGRLDFSGTRELVYQALQASHAKEFPTTSQAGDLIDTIGVPKAIEALTALLQANAAKATNGDGPGNPPPAQ